MNFQEIIVLAFVAAAVMYVALMIYKKTRSFSAKSGCGNNCGCFPKTKQNHTAA